MYSVQILLAKSGPIKKSLPLTFFWPNGGATLIRPGALLKLPLEMVKKNTGF